MVRTQCAVVQPAPPARSASHRPTSSVRAVRPWLAQADIDRIRSSVCVSPATPTSLRERTTAGVTRWVIANCGRTLARLSEVRRAFHIDGIGIGETCKPIRSGARRSRGGWPARPAVLLVRQDEDAVGLRPCRPGEPRRPTPAPRRIQISSDSGAPLCSISPAPTGVLLRRGFILRPRRGAHLAPADDGVRRSRSSVRGRAPTRSTSRADL